MTNRTPLNAAVLLLLPVLYLGSYVALVTLSSGSIVVRTGMLHSCDYRWGEPYTSDFFHPLEQIDRRLRPGTWRTTFIRTRRRAARIRPRMLSDQDASLPARRHTGSSPSSAG